MINNSKISANIFMSAFNYDLKNENKKNYTKKRKLTESSIKQDLSNSLAIEKNLENQFYSESNYSKKIKGKINTFLNKNEKNNELRIPSQSSGKVQNPISLCAVGIDNKYSITISQSLYSSLLTSAQRQKYDIRYRKKKITKKKKMKMN